MAQPAGSSGPSDWTVQVADTIERVVAGVRNKTTKPLVGIARWVVYGLLAAVVGSVALLLLLIGAVRLLAQVPGGVWVPDLVLGGIFSLAGLLLWSKRRATDH